MILPGVAKVMAAAKVLQRRGTNTVRAITKRVSTVKFVVNGGQSRGNLDSMTNDCVISEKIFRARLRRAHTTTRSPLYSVNSV